METAQGLSSNLVSAAGVRPASTAARQSILRWNSGGAAFRPIEEVHEMSSIAKAPWQVAFSACSAIVVGMGFASSSLLQISYSGDFAAIDTRISEYQAVSGLESASSPLLPRSLFFSAFSCGRGPFDRASDSPSPSLP